MRSVLLTIALLLTSPAISGETRTLDVFDFASSPGQPYVLETDLAGFYKVEIEIISAMTTGSSRLYLRFITDDGLVHEDGRYNYFSQGLLAGNTRDKPEIDSNSSGVDNFRSDRIVLQDSENKPMTPIHGQITILAPGDTGQRKVVRTWIVADDSNERIVGEQTFALYLGDEPLRGLVLFGGDPIVAGHVIVTGYSLDANLTLK